VERHGPAKSRNFSWITLGIRISCNNKRNLYLWKKKEENPSLKDYYNKYCKILNNVMVAAKKMAYNNYIKTSHNKQKSTWKIIDTESGRTHKRNDHNDLIKKINDSNVADQINDYFISIGNKIIKSSNSSDSSDTD
jgi:hypothetical protein